MTVTSPSPKRPGAVHDPERRGILIPASQLAGSPFNVGDRFSIRKGLRDFFCVSIQRDPAGEIHFEKYGIFIPRSRRVDAYMGGIFHEFIVDFPASHPDRIKITPVGTHYVHIGGAAPV